MAIGDTIASGEQDAGSVAQANGRGRGIVQTLRLAARAVFDVILPPLCVGCGTRLLMHDSLCSACWKEIDFIRPPLCDRLGIPMPYDTGEPMISAAAIADPPDFDRARSVARHDRLMRRLIHKFKFNDSQHARRLFGRWLCEAGAELICEADVIVAVPLARWRLIGRRFNQSQILAHEVGRICSKPVATMALERSRATQSQVGLSRSERKRNVAGAFRVRAGEAHRVAGKRILLIDDVVTTGATVNAAARALRKCGATTVMVLSLSIAGDVPHAP